MRRGGAGGRAKRGGPPHAPPLPSPPPLPPHVARARGVDAVQRGPALVVVRGQEGGGGVRARVPVQVERVDVRRHPLTQHVPRDGRFVGRRPRGRLLLRAHGELAPVGGDAADRDARVVGDGVGARVGAGLQHFGDEQVFDGLGGEDKGGGGAGVGDARGVGVGCAPTPSSTIPAPGRRHLRSARRRRYWKRREAGRVGRTSQRGPRCDPAARRAPPAPRSQSQGHARIAADHAAAPATPLPPRSLTRPSRPPFARSPSGTRARPGKRCRPIGRTAGVWGEGEGWAAGDAGVRPRRARPPAARSPRCRCRPWRRVVGTEGPAAAARCGGRESARAALRPPLSRPLCLAEPCTSSASVGASRRAFEARPAGRRKSEKKKKGSFARGWPRAARACRPGPNLASKGQWRGAGDGSQREGVVGCVWGGGRGARAPGAGPALSARLAATRSERVCKGGNGGPGHAGAAAAACAAASDRSDAITAPNPGRAPASCDQHARMSAT